METFRTITEAPHLEEFLISIDLTEAYLHIPTSFLHRRFLRRKSALIVQSLSNTSCVFPKNLFSPIILIKKQGIHFLPYLDNLLMSNSKARSHLDSLEPPQRIELLGVIIENTTDCLLLPKKKAQKIKEM